MTSTPLRDLRDRAHALASVPTLDELAAEPSRARALPDDALRTSALRALSLHAALVTELMTRPAPVPAAPVRLLTTEEVVALTGHGRNWVLAHKAELGAIQPHPRAHPRYPSDRVEGYISGRAAELTRTRKGV